MQADMTVRALLLCLGILTMPGCSEDAPPPQPAPPPDRNFTATVNDTPVVGGTQSFGCQIKSSSETGVQQYMLTFTDDTGHTIQAGIERGDDDVGERRLLSAMATAEGRAYGQPKEASATLTAVVPTAQGAVISGRFNIELALVNSAPGVTDKAPLRVNNALFEQVECLDPSKLSNNVRP